MHPLPRFFAPFGLSTVISALQNAAASSPALGALSVLGARPGAQTSSSFAAMCASQLSAPAGNGTDPSGPTPSVSAASVTTGGNNASQGLVVGKGPSGAPNSKDSTKNQPLTSASALLAAFLLPPMPSLPEIVAPTLSDES